MADTRPQPTSAEKERTAQLVAALSRQDQVDLLAQALLREFMHRKGFRSTLKAFDTENPRDERTISSRALMRDLLNIPVLGRVSRLQPAAAAEGRQRDKKAPTAPTFMEELCSYRLTKRDHVRRARQRRDEDGGRGDPEAGLAAYSEDPSDIELAELRARSEARREECRTAAAALAERQARRADKKKNKKDKRRKTRQHDGDNDSDGSDVDDDDGGSLDRARRREKRRGKRQNEKGKASLSGFSPFDSEESSHTQQLSGGTSVGSSWAPPGVSSSSGKSGNHRHKEDDSADSSDSSDPFSLARTERLRDIGSYADSEEPHWRGGAAASSTFSSCPSTTLAGRHPYHTGAVSSLMGGPAPMAAVSRSEITEAWRPGGGVTTSSSTDAGTPNSFRGRGALGGGGGGARMPAPTAGSIMRPSSIMASSSLSTSPEAKHSYDRSAVPRSSALSSSSVRSPPSEGAEGRATGVLRQGIGFRKDANTTTPVTGRQDRKVKLMVD